MECFAGGACRFLEAWAVSEGVGRQTSSARSRDVTTSFSDEFDVTRTSCADGFEFPVFAFAFDFEDVQSSTSRVARYHERNSGIVRMRRGMPPIVRVD